MYEMFHDACSVIHLAPSVSTSGGETLGSPACGDATSLLLTDDVAENTLSGSSLGGLAASTGIDAQVFLFCFVFPNLISRAEGVFFKWTAKHINHLITSPDGLIQSLPAYCSLRK